MGRTEGAIKSLYHRTLNALREDVELKLAQQAELEDSDQE
jgi:hypothetical protein